jgi:MoaA/NifB/PqqE/SkfB family radical SAM enzyme
MIKTWSWEFTDRCNLACKHCLIDPAKSDGVQFDKPTYLEIVSRIKRFGGENILVTGGEAFFIDGFMEIAQSAKALGMKISVVTNGTIVSDEDKIKQIANTFDVVGISFDGPESEHDTVRGKRTYQRSLRFAQKLLASGGEVVAFVTLNGLNHDKIKELATALISAGIQAIHVNELNVVGRAITNDWLHLSGQREATKQSLLSQLGELIEIDESRAWSTECSIGRHEVHMMHNGDIFSCVELGNYYPDKAIASIFDDDLLEKWDDYFRDFVPATVCAYETFVDDGIVLQLNCGKCPFVEAVR